MKGVVFTEFVEMVEDQFSPAVADRIIARADSPCGGAYTAVGTYDHGELIRLVGALSKDTGTDASELVKAFGRHLFAQFVAGYPQFFDDVASSFDFLENVDDYIHQEVRKLYPDAELPRFECERHNGSSLVMTYRSPRPFADLAEGLIDACIEHFDEAIEIAREDLDDGSGTSARFRLDKRE